MHSLKPWLFQFLNKLQSLFLMSKWNIWLKHTRFCAYFLIWWNWFLVYQKSEMHFSHPIPPSILLPLGTAVHSTLAQDKLSGWRPTALDDLSWLELNESEWELVNLDLNTGYKQLLRVKWSDLRQKGSCKGALDPRTIKMFIILADIPPSPMPEEEKAPSPPPVPALKTELEPASTEVRAC